MPIPWNRLQPSAEGWLGLVGTVLYLCFGLLVFYRTIRQLVEWTTSLFTTRKVALGGRKPVMELPATMCL